MSPEENARLEQLSAEREADHGVIRDFLHAHSESLSDEDEGLLGHAKGGIKVRYAHGWVQTYCVCMSHSGRLIAKPNQEQNVGAISNCAEPFAINEADDQQVIAETFVVVRQQRPDEGKDVHVVTPCGACRERIAHHNPHARVIIWLGGDYKCYRKIRIIYLLPMQYKIRIRPNGNGVSGHQFKS